MDHDLIFPIAAYICLALLIISLVGELATDGDSRLFNVLFWVSCTALLLLELALIFYDQYLKQLDQ